MRTSPLGGLLLPATALLLAACSDGSTAPLAPALTHPSANVVAAGACGGVQQSGAMRAVDILSGVTVTANFSGASFGLPSNIRQAMNFGWADASTVPCFNTEDVTYEARETTSSDTTTEDVNTVPPGVDAEAWRSLSPRERAVLLEAARKFMELYPGVYPSVGAVITNRLMPVILRAKVDSKVLALNFLQGAQGELLAGGIYGCELFTAFATDPDWVLLRPATLQLVADLSAALAETLFGTRPLTGLLFARNGAFGAQVAIASGRLPIDCGWSVFNAVPSGRISVTDPYGTPQGSPLKPLLPDGTPQWDQ